MAVSVEIVDAMKRDFNQTVRTIMDRFEFEPDCFVETGTFRGDTAALMGELFRDVYTIELSSHYYDLAKTRFQGTNIECIHGDSAQVLADLVEAINEPAVWFLDAHWVRRNPKHQKLIASDNPMPLLDELQHLSRRGHRDIIIVDDTQLFETKLGYYPWWRRISETKIYDIIHPSQTMKLDYTLAMVKEPSNGAQLA